MRCEIAEREISARLDGAQDPTLRREVAQHLSACGRCAAFATGSLRLRQLARVEDAAPVPDLVDAIMRDVRQADRAPRLRGWARDATVFAAAASVAAVALVGLPAVRRGPPAVQASQIPGHVLATAKQTEEFAASFDLLERNYAPEVPVRRFRASIAFRAPEQVRWTLRDLTRYPSGAWPRNHVDLAVDVDRASLAGPRSCPREVLPSCSGGSGDVMAVRGRAPFDAEAPLPTDIVLPVKTLAAAGRVRVLGQGEEVGRPAVRVELAVRDARPLLAALQAGGSWRPLFAGDRVELALDRETWFPLSYAVRVAEQPERDAWAARNGLPREEAGTEVLGVRARWFRASVPPGWRPGVALPSRVEDRGFRDVPWSRLAETTGFVPAMPTELRGLRRHRAGVFVHVRDAGVVTSYARGSAWLEVREVRGWDGTSFFGGVSVDASPVRLHDGGVGYHEPPSTSLARRLAIHAEDRDLIVESNLPLPAVIDIASSMGIDGVAIPSQWRVERVGDGTIRHGVRPATAAELSPFMALPRRLPPEYRLWSVALSFAEGARVPRAVTSLFRRSGGEFEGEGVRLYEALGTELPPPTDPGALSVRVGRVLGRYSPLGEELEWNDGGVYRALRGPGLDVATLVDIAESLQPATQVLV